MPPWRSARAVGLLALMPAWIAAPPPGAAHAVPEQWQQQLGMMPSAEAFTFGGPLAASASLAALYGSGGGSQQTGERCPWVRWRAVPDIPAVSHCLGSSGGSSGGGGGDGAVRVCDEQHLVSAPDLLLCECAELCLEEPACTVMQYKEERGRAYGLGSTCSLYESCEHTRLYTDHHAGEAAQPTFCFHIAEVTPADEMTMRIHRLHGRLGVYPTALAAETEILQLQLKLRGGKQRQQTNASARAPPPLRRSAPQPAAGERCEPWRRVAAGWAEQSGLVVSQTVYAGPRDAAAGGGCRPLLALLVPVTSRQTNTSMNGGIAAAPLLQILLPSLLRTLRLSDRSDADALDYVLAIGFDEGDALWDTPEAHAQLPALVAAAAEKLLLQPPLEAATGSNGTAAADEYVSDVAPRLSLMVHRCGTGSNKSGSMVRATNCIAKRAHAVGAEWSYRVNDDSWLQTANWGPALIRSLAAQSTGALQNISSGGTRSAGVRSATTAAAPRPALTVVGVAGPHCSDGKQWTEGDAPLLVMDFVHRTHYEIFGYHYHPAFNK